MMRIHPRESLVREVEIKLLAFVTRETACLTEAEALRVVNAVCSDWIAHTARQAIREERHGNTDTPGGLAPLLPTDGDPR